MAHPLSIKMIKRIVAVVFFGLIFSFTSHAQSAYDVCVKTFKNTKSINTMTYTMFKNERIGGVMKSQKSFTKLSLKPYMVYLRQISPKEGVEVLYKSGKNGGKALVNPNGFPWVNLNMNPMGSTMRKGQHHTTKDAGFDLVVSILEYLFNKYGEGSKSMVTFGNEVLSNKRKCYKIIFRNDSFKYIKYKVRANENILDIAKRYKISEFMIVGKNKDVAGYYDVKAGDEILIPNIYSPHMVLLIDKTKLIPLSVKVYDDLGLFEHFKYSDVVLNPKLTAMDFDRDNAKYGF